MIIGSSKTTDGRNPLEGIADIDLLSFYLGIKNVPCIIRSPLRVDNKPSFRLFSFDGVKVFYKDFSTGESGSIIDLLSRYLNLDYKETIKKILEDRQLFAPEVGVCKVTSRRELGKVHKSQSTITVQERDWEEYDFIYWNDFGIDLGTLDNSKVSPISGFYIDKGNGPTYYKANKLAYAYREDKDGITTYKIYQPTSKCLKWLSKHDASVISLWTCMPKSGDRLVICSSLKDALSLQCNTGIPAIALQGEGYLMSKTAIDVLKSRFKEVIVLFDNDDAGRRGTQALTAATGFRASYPVEEFVAKDVSDLYKKLRDKNKFANIILKTLDNGKKDCCDGYQD